MICTRSRPGHFSIRIGDSSPGSVEIVKNLKLRLWMQLLLLLLWYSVDWFHSQWSTTFVIQFQVYTFHCWLTCIWEIWVCWFYCMCVYLCECFSLSRDYLSRGVHEQHAYFTSQWTNKQKVFSDIWPFCNLFLSSWGVSSLYDVWKWVYGLSFQWENEQLFESVYVPLEYTDHEILATNG